MGNLDVLIGGKAGHISTFCNPRVNRTSPKQRGDINQNRNGSNCSWNLGSLITIPLSIDGIQYEGCVDTGSVISIMNASIAYKLNAAISVYKGSAIYSGNGDKYHPKGATVVDITITDNEGNKRVVRQHVMLVEGFHFDILLGNDFNETAGTLIKFVDGVKYIDFTESANNKIRVRNNESTCNVHSSESIVIPRRSTAFAKISVSKKQSENKCLGIISSNYRPYYRKKLIVANAMVQIENGMGDIIVSNFSFKDTKITPGEVLGKFEEVEYYSEGKSEPIYNTGSAFCMNNKDEDNNKYISLKEGDIRIGDSLGDMDKRELKLLLESYKDVFAFDSSQLGEYSKVSHTIPTEVPPIHVPPYRYPPHKRKEISDQIEKMIELDVVQPSSSPYASPVVLVLKKDNTYRICVDFRKLNSVTKTDIYPLPNIDDALSSFNGCQYFSTLDCNAGYWQINVDKSDREKTAFVTQDGHYEFKRMPFGLKNAPSCFQRVMDVILAGLKWSECLVYLDDIIVFADSFKQMISRLESVFKRMRSSGLTLKPSKCFLAADSVPFLGHIVSKDGIKPDPSKLNAISDFKPPVNLKALRSFLGLASYYRKFIDNFSKIVRPMTDLTKKESDFIWGEKENQSFEEIKLKLISFPTLAHYNPNAELKIRTDACGYGIGAALLQKCGDDFKPLSFASRRMSRAEMNYTISEQECLAVIYAIERFEQYLTPNPFIIETDHCALCWIKTKAKLPARLHRYTLLLKPYNYTIKYRSGHSNKDADCLSRYPVDPPSEPIDITDRLVLS